jgi:hypothetical protein
MMITINGTATTPLITADQNSALMVLFITGYAGNSVLGNGRLAPGMAVMTKLFPRGNDG